MKWKPQQWRGKRKWGRCNEDRAAVSVEVKGACIEGEGPSQASTAAAKTQQPEQSEFSASHVSRATERDGSEGQMKLALANLLRFPCDDAKRPMMRAWQRNAGRFDYGRWPLVGVSTGEANGFDVLDVDVEGLRWFEAHRERLPRTHGHRTRSGGLHVFFRHSMGLRCSAGRIAQGVDVRADGGFIVWWPREGFASEERALAQWPDWLLLAARKKLVDRSQCTSAQVIPPSPGDAVGVLDALGKLDPECWRGKHDEWLALMMACKFVGVGVDDFVEWSIGDPVYANDEDVIRRKWESVAPKHGGALWAALKEAGIKLTHTQHTQHTQGDGLTSAEVPRLLPTERGDWQGGDWRHRISGILRWLERHPTEGDLFSAACLVAEIIAEGGKPAPSTAAKLLCGAAKANGLARAIGAEEVQRTIGNGLRHVEEKVLMN
jgi:Bifunctional DNA primase/polymerase, N-terminal/Primase C terminal 2 (PriCT-2)